MTQTASIRNAVANAVALNKIQELPGLLAEMSVLPMTAEVLAETGISVLLEYEPPWEKADVITELAVLKFDWMALLTKAEQKGSKVEIRRSSTFRGLEAGSFLEIVNKLEVFLKMDRDNDQLETYRSLALRLALRGFDAPCALDCVEPDDLEEVWTSPWEKSVIARACQAATDAGAERRKQICQARAKQSTVQQAVPVSNAHPCPLGPIS